MEESPEIKMDNSAEIESIKKQKAFVSAQIELEQMKFELYELRLLKIEVVVFLLVLQTVEL